MSREGFAVRAARPWGFDPVGPAVIWAKDSYGTGLFPRPAHEMLMVCRKADKALWNREDGRFVFEIRSTHSVQRWGQVRGTRNTGKQHSRKPEGAQDLIERISPPPF